MDFQPADVKEATNLQTINHFVCTKDVKIFAKNEEELKKKQKKKTNPRKHAIKINRRDIGMKLWIEKCAMLIRGKGEKCK